MHCRIRACGLDAAALSQAVADAASARWRRYSATATAVSSAARSVGGVVRQAVRREQIRTRPYRQRTNGKAERFIQTLLREWAYAAVYRDSGQRARALAPRLRCCNERRPRGALGHKTSAGRLATEERS